MYRFETTMKGGEVHRRQVLEKAQLMWAHKFGNIVCVYDGDAVILAARQVPLQIHAPPAPLATWPWPLGRRNTAQRVAVTLSVLRPQHPPPLPYPYRASAADPQPRCRAAVQHARARHNRPFPHDKFKFEMKDPRDKDKKRKQDVSSTVTKVSEINMELIKRYYDGQLGVDELNPAIINCLNLVFRGKHSKNEALVGRNNNFFSKKAPKNDLGQGCELWTGWHQSLRATQRKMMCNVDFATSVFYKPIKVQAFINEHLQNRGRELTAFSDDQLKIARR